MPTIDEKRVYSDTREAESVAVAAEVGLVVVSVSGDFVGDFGVVHRGACRAVASADGTLAVATDADVTLLPPDADEPRETGFGPATDVSVAGDDLLALGPDGTVGRRRLAGGAAAEDGWTTVGTVADGRALDGDLLAASDGVYRVGERLAHAGLDDVRDVAVADVPRAATGRGLYRLGNGWLDEVDAPCRLVAAAPDGRGHVVAAAGGEDRDDDASGDERLLAHDAAGDWTPVASPVGGRVAGVAYGETATYLVSAGGTLAVVDGDGWRSQPLGVRGVGGLTVR